MIERCRQDPDQRRNQLTRSEPRLDCSWRREYPWIARYFLVSRYALLYYILYCVGSFLPHGPAVLCLKDRLSGDIGLNNTRIVFASLSRSAVFPSSCPSNASLTPASISDPIVRVDCRVLSRFNLDPFPGPVNALVFQSPFRIPTSAGLLPCQPEDELLYLSYSLYAHSFCVPGLPTPRRCEGEESSCQRRLCESLGVSNVLPTSLAA